MTMVHITSSSDSGVADGAASPRSALRRGARGVLAGVCGLALACTGAVAVAPAASAQTGSVSDNGFTHPDFYAPPSELPGGDPGQLIRSEPMGLAFDGLPGFWQGDAQRVMYTSIGARGGEVPVTGTYIRSSKPAPGGDRPLAVVAPGTQGAGDQCAPSRNLETGLNVATSPPSISPGYEAVAAWTLVDRGFDVLVTDYEGLGTPGQHTYVNSDAQAHAVLDGARGAIAASDGRLSPESPVVVTGYSQGGGAAAAAAEAAPDYAPDLNLKGVNASAAPLDLRATLKQVDGNLIAGVIGYAINSFLATDPSLQTVLDEELNDAGKRLLADTANQCIGDSILTYPLRSTSDFSKSGESLDQIIERRPELSELLDSQKLGEKAPQVPVRLQGNLNDDVIPYEPIKNGAASWCAGGTAVEFVTDGLPPIVPRSAINHMTPYLTNINTVNDYLVDRVLDRPAPQNCAG
jgi:alpha-beta hydrolase superfamily lysophospholipase